MKSLACLAALASLLIGCATSGPAPSVIKPAAGAQTPQDYTAAVVRTNHLDYLLYLPKDYSADPTKQWPLVLFLHGSGERGTNLMVVAKHGPPKLVAAGQQFPFILASPQCPEGQVWDDSALFGLLDRLQSQLRVDPKRVYITGLSMGGYGTWSLITKHPERFAAAAPVCGGGERIRTLLPSQKEALKTLPVRVFHGGKDNVVPLAESERMVEAFKAAGNANITLTVYPEAGHDSWTATYGNPEFFEWLLKQSR
jgi:predicted peptidase